MIGRQLIDALRREEPEPPPSRPVPPPPPPPQPPELIVRFDGEISGDDLRAIREAIKPPRAVLGYAVARWDGAGRKVLTHTSLMPRAEAEREAGAQRRADQHGYSWAVVEIRSAS